MKKTLSVGEEILFKANRTLFKYRVTADCRGCGYFLGGYCDNKAIFTALGIDSNRHEFVKQIVGKDYSSGNCPSTSFPVCTTLEALTKVVDALIKMCEGESDAFVETGAVESTPKVVIRATTRVRVNLK